MKIKAVIEIPMWSNYKFETKDNKLVLDRVLNQNIPYNYGYVPNTLSADKDSLDVFIISSRPIPSGIECEVELMGAFDCYDKGIKDDKLFGVLVGDMVDDELHTIVANINHYLTTYKDKFVVEGVYYGPSAESIYERDIINP